MIYLADVNVWLAVAVDDHIHHSTALAWLERSHPSEIAFCRITQAGFFRLLTNEHVMGKDTLSPAQAWASYDRLRSNYRFTYYPEPSNMERYWRQATKDFRGGPNSWTDAYLAGFAAAAGFTIVTFDRAFLTRRHANVEVLPVVQ
jgi:toxin-antitoxin system PIN domain toxin